MATQIRGIIKVESICYEFIDRMEYDRSSIRKVFSYFIDGYRDISTYHISNPVFEKKKIPANGILDFPTDCVFINNIFMPVDGVMVPLSRKNDIVRTTSIVSGAETREGEDGEGEPINIDTQGSNAEAYNQLGYYAVSNTDRRIIFLSDWRDEAIISYTTAGISRYDSYIPVMYKTPLMNYIRWQFSRDNKESQNMVEINRRDYLDSLEMLRQSVGDWTLQDLAEAFCTNTQIPTR